MFPQFRIVQGSLKVARPMRYSPAEQLVALLLELGSARAGLSVADIMERFRVSRRTAERMLSAAQRLAPLEALTAWEDRRKRWRLKRLPAVLAIHGRVPANRAESHGRLAEPV
jgi:hypothetical protein